MLCIMHMLQDKQKLDSRAKKGIFINKHSIVPLYIRTYSIYFKERRDIKRVRCVTFTNRFDNDNYNDYVDEICCSMRKQASPIDV